jgi:glutamate/tyrosine decarboxylase-like PLP-dependent enzyme
MSLLGATYSFRKTLIASVFPGFDFIALYLTLSAGGRDEITPLYRNQLQATQTAQKTRRVPAVRCIIPVYFRDALLACAHYLRCNTHTLNYILKDAEFIGLRRNGVSIGA